MWVVAGKGGLNAECAKRGVDSGVASTAGVSAVPAASDSRLPSVLLTSMSAAIKRDDIQTHGLSRAMKPDVCTSRTLWVDALAFDTLRALAFILARLDFAIGESEGLNGSLNA